MNKNNSSIEITPIGYVTSGRVDAIDDNWGNIISKIKLVDPFDSNSIAGISDFSHLEVIFHFHKVEEERIEIGARHPRNNKNWPLVGIFAQRGKARPNRLGICVCKIINITNDVIEVQGLDAIVGTPIIDIKPVMREFLPQGEIVEPEWAVELMKNYWE